MRARGDLGSNFIPHIKYNFSNSNINTPTPSDGTVGHVASDKTSSLFPRN